MDLYPQDVGIMKSTTWKLRLEEEELARWKGQAAEEGMPLSQWIREACNSHVEDCGAENVRGNRAVRVARRRTMRNGNSGGAGTVQATRGGRYAENSSVAPHSDEFVPLTSADASTWKPEVAAEPSGKNFHEANPVCQSDGIQGSEGGGLSTKTASPKGCDTASHAVKERPADYSEEPDWAEAMIMRKSGHPQGCECAMVCGKLRAALKPKEKR